MNLNDILSKLQSVSCDVKVRECCGIYDTIVKVKYGANAKDVGWIYMKEDKILLIHIKDETINDIETFVNRILQLKNEG